MRSMRVILIACTVLAAATSRAAGQPPAGEQALARATAAAILEQYQPRLFLLTPPPARFDTMVAVELLAQAPGRQDPEADYALYVGTRGAEMRGDTAVVSMVMHQHTREKGLNYWRQTDEFRFVREGEGWRLVGHMVMDIADGGDVRGR